MSKLKKLSEVQPKKDDKWLNKSFKRALELLPPVSIEKLKEVNAEIIAKLQKKNKRKAKEEKKEHKVKIKEEESFEGRLRALCLKVDRKVSLVDQNSDSRKSRLPAMKKSAELVNSFTIQNYIQLESNSIEEIVEVIEEITELDYSKKLLNSSNLIRILKYFRAFLTDSSDTEVRKLVKLVDHLLDYFEKLMVMNQILDDEIRDDEIKLDKKNIRGEILETLAKKGFAGSSGSKIMRRIESKLKEIDPSQGRDFLKKYTYILQELNRTQNLSLEDLIQKVFNSHINS